MWQRIRSMFAPADSPASDPAPSRITIVSILLEDQDRSLLATVSQTNPRDVVFVKTCAEAKQVSEQIKPHIILLDRDLAEGDWRQSLSACASSSGGACTVSCLFPGWPTIICGTKWSPMAVTMSCVSRSGSKMSFAPLSLRGSTGTAPGRRPRALRNDALPNRVQDQFREAVQVQFVLQVPAMSLHCVKTKIQQRGDIFVGFSFGQ